MFPEIRIEQVSPDAPDVLALIRSLDTYQESLYPSESNHLDGLDTLMQPNVIMMGAREGNVLAGIGAVKVMDGYGEIKRMYIPDEHRKKGLGGILLKTLEHLAVARGCACVRLETGIHQAAALALYRKAGFVDIPAFADYPDDPLSVFMEKTLPGLDDLLNIVPYTDKYRYQVIRLWEACGLTVPWNDPGMDIQRKIDDSPDLFFIALIDDRVIGSCMAGYDGHRGWFYYLGVSPEFRRNGIAERMIRHGEERLMARGCPKINLMVRKTNRDVIGFYKSTGYDDDPVVVLSKRLTPESQGRQR
ncbi:MAG: GNAT family acetyltransferase [Desulfobacter sp.]